MDAYSLQCDSLLVNNGKIEQGKREDEHKLEVSEYQLSNISGKLAVSYISVNNITAVNSNIIAATLLTSPSVYLFNSTVDGGFVTASYMYSSGGMFP